jgi:hypothetical protein
MGGGRGPVPQTYTGREHDGNAVDARVPHARQPHTAAAPEPAPGSETNREYYLGATVVAGQ